MKLTPAQREDLLNEIERWQKRSENWPPLTRDSNLFTMYFFVFRDFGISLGRISTPQEVEFVISKLREAHDKTLH